MAPAEESSLTALKALLAGKELPPSLVIAGDLDSTLRRFLKARQGSVEKAHAMVLACLKWRSKEETASVYARALPEPKFRRLCRYFPHAHHGFDRQGQPIYIDCTGQLDVDKLLEVVAPEEVLLSHIIMMEYQNRVLMSAASSRWGATVHKMCNIVDLRGASMRLTSRKVLDIFKGIAAIDQPNYPETMGATYVVNAPWVFTAIWKIVRVFLDEGVTAKVHILGEGEPTRAALSKAVDPDQLPAFLGGTCACPGGCVSGPTCTSPDGLVPSQRRLFAYCTEFARLQADSAPDPFPLLHANLPGSVEALVAAAPPVDRAGMAAAEEAAAAAAAAAAKIASPRATTPKATRVAVTNSPAGPTPAPLAGVPVPVQAGVPPAREAPAAPRRRGWLCCCGGDAAAADAPAEGVIDLGGVSATVTTTTATASVRKRNFDSFRSDMFQDALDEFALDDLHGPEG